MRRWSKGLQRSRIALKTLVKRGLTTTYQRVLSSWLNWSRGSAATTFIQNYLHRKICKWWLYKRLVTKLLLPHSKRQSTTWRGLREPRGATSKPDSRSVSNRTWRYRRILILINRGTNRRREMTRHKLKIIKYFQRLRVLSLRRIHRKLWNSFKIWKILSLSKKKISTKNLGILQFSKRTLPKQPLVLNLQRFQRMNPVLKKKWNLKNLKTPKFWLRENQGTENK